MLDGLPGVEGLRRLATECAGVRPGERCLLITDSAADQTVVEAMAVVLRGLGAEVAVVELITAIKDAKAGGATDEQVKAARDLQRKAQWRADFMNAENSFGFHAPAESLRILGEAIDYARQGTTEIAKLGIKPVAPVVK